jgi:hypothetical protein
MQHSIGQRSATAPAVLGLLLITVGIFALVLRELDVNPFEAIGEWGWPLFVIVPGVVLLGVALIPAPPRGVGFAIAGAIVTTVGGLLLYQWRTGHWESWAYVWALIPAAAGVALVLYGLLSRERGMISIGSWLAGIGALIFTAGAWFFEGLFAGDTRPDVADWWPLALVALGIVIALRALLAAPTVPATAARPGTPPAPTNESPTAAPSNPT